mmetsp:Transcript_613/g.592  ORF Transcript_613/g.592 Transcript_613/m.592 type:complete len:122 (+) Transcript_613:65-430(+)
MSSDQKVRIQIQFCGGSGYGPYFLELKEYLMNHPKLEDKIDIVMIYDRELTGNFEITIVDNNHLIHSRTKHLHPTPKGIFSMLWTPGVCATEVERNSVVNQILSFMYDTTNEISIERDECD